MKTNTITAKVKQIIKKGYSFYGNPHYSLTLETPTGTEIQCKTAVNGSIGYGLTNYQNRYGIFTYHETAKGTIILDYAKDIIRKGKRNNNHNTSRPKDQESRKGSKPRNKVGEQDESRTREENERQTRANTDAKG